MGGGEGDSRPFRTDHHPFSDLLLGGFRHLPPLCGASSVFQLRGPHARACFITCSFFIKKKTSYFADKGLFLPILSSPVSVSPPLSVQTPPQTHSVCSQVQGTNTRAAPRRRRPAPAPARLFSEGVPRRRSRSALARHSMKCACAWRRPAPARPL